MRDPVSKNKPNDKAEFFVSSRWCSDPDVSLSKKTDEQTRRSKEALKLQSSSFWEAAKRMQGAEPYFQIASIVSKGVTVLIIAFIWLV